MTDVVVRASGRSAARCPYCLDALGLQPSSECASCRTPLHDECRATAGGCTTLGCAASPRVAAGWRAPTAAPPTRRRREPPLWPWLGRGRLRAALAYLLAFPVVVLTLVVTILVGVAIGAATDLPIVGLAGLFVALLAASAAGHETVAWFRGEP